MTVAWWIDRTILVVNVSWQRGSGTSCISKNYGKDRLPSAQYFRNGFVVTTVFPEIDFFEAHEKFFKTASVKRFVRFYKKFQYVRNSVAFVHRSKRLRQNGFCAPTPES